LPQIREIFFYWFDVQELVRNWYNVNKQPLVNGLPRKFPTCCVEGRILHVVLKGVFAKNERGIGREGMQGRHKPLEMTYRAF